jgi:hypothetical protein
MVLRRLAVLLASGCVAAMIAPCHGQTSAAERAAYMAGLRFDRSMLAGSLATSPRSAMSASDPQESPARQLRQVNLIGQGVVLEMPRGDPGTEGFQRPRLLIGLQSQALRTWMSEMGLPPERCMLPMFRGRLKRSPETGKMGAAVLVSGSCTFF